MANAVHVDVDFCGVYVAPICSAYVEASFDKGIELLASESYHLISLESAARLRMQEGTGAFSAICGNFVRESVLYVPKKGIFLAKKSPILKNPKFAVECSAKKQKYYIPNIQLEESLEGAIMFPKVMRLPTAEFANIELTADAFGKAAGDYGMFLKKFAKIESISIYLAALENKPFAIQLWFHGLACMSGLEGCDYGLSSNNRLRGIKYARGIKNDPLKIIPALQ